MLVCRLALRIDYQRQTDALSISSLPVQAASTPGTGYPRARFDDRYFCPGWLAESGLLLIGAGIAGFVVLAAR